MTSTEAVIGKATRILRRLQYEFLLAPKGRGFPVSKATWDRQYREGVWDSLNSLSELGHYMIVAGYVNHFLILPRVLDVGCGHGRLLPILEPFGFQSYLGIDLSDEAVAAARLCGISSTSFEVADFEDYTPTGKFDAIIFNESLCYANRPVDVLRRYSGALAEHGILIVSLCDYGNHVVIWRQIESAFGIIDSTTVSNASDQTWNIKVLAALGDPGEVEPV